MQEYTIEYIIQYLRKQLPQEEQFVFEQALSEQSLLRKEVREIEEILLLQKIEDYLKHELPPEEKLAFQQKIQKNADLQSKIKSVQRADQFLDEWIQADILDDVERIAQSTNIEEELPTVQSNDSPSRSQGIKRFKWTVAAGFLLISSFGFYFLYLPSQHSNRAIVEEVYEAYPGRGNLLTLDSSALASSFHKGMALYDEAKYAEAITHLKEVSIDDPSYWMTQVYLGNALMSEKNPAAAIPVLANITQQSSYQDQGLWYLALAQLQNGEVAAANQTLDQLLRITEDNFYRKKAQKVKKRIGYFWRNWPGVN